MVRNFLIMMAMVATVGACTSSAPSGGQLGADGAPLPKVYRIRNSQTGNIQFRMLDSANSLRQAGGLAPVALDPQLNAAAATHSLDMAAQNRPWHFGSDGSSPIDRVARAGYPGPVVGEAISETYETELETLGAWMEDGGSRGVIMDPQAINMGFAWHQEKNGKLWWTLVMGG